MPGESYFLPAGEVSVEIIIKNSHFISFCAPVSSVDKAKEYIEKIKQAHPAASHHVPAYIIGHGSSTISHCSDNGEPAGTAGKPTLAVLQGSEMGDIILVTVRYFGGTKLGTGGLVRAYTESAQAVLKLVTRAIKLATHTILVELPYPLLELGRRLVGHCQGKIEKEEFSDSVLLTCVFPVSAYDAFVNQLRELSNGQIEPLIVETNPNTIFPIE
jgi:uncharacterized YigZ family protein